MQRGKDELVSTLIIKLEIKISTLKVVYKLFR